MKAKRYKTCKIYLLSEEEQGMKVIKIHVSTGYVGSTKTDVLMVEDDATEEEIKELALQWLWENVDFAWYEEE